MTHGITGKKTGSGTNDNDVVIQLDQNAEAYDVFLLMSTAGAMDVFASLDGTNYSTSAVSLADLGAISTDPVIVTAAGRLYGFRGKYQGIRVLQNGATAVENAVLRYGTM